jgi:uncharacterized membrane protein
MEKLIEAASGQNDSNRPQGGLEKVLQRNVDVIKQIEESAKNQRSLATRISDVIAGFCGSIVFVWVHVAWFSAWLFINTHAAIPKGLRFDAPPYPILTLTVSLEAIFLSTFILISQNRQQVVADHRNNLDLQINLLSEQENSEMLRLLRMIGEKMGLDVCDGRLEALQEETDALKVAKQLDMTNQALGKQALSDS